MPYVTKRTHFIFEPLPSWLRVAVRVIENAPRAADLWETRTKGPGGCERARGELVGMPIRLRWSVFGCAFSCPIAGLRAPQSFACVRFMDDFEACIAHLRFPVTHRRAIRTTNLLERLFVEERRRLKIIPNAFGRESRLETDVRRGHPSRRAMALDQSQRVRTSADHCR
jgi:hypothetical protein